MGILGLTFELQDSHKTLRITDSSFYLGAHTQVHISKIFTSILGSLRDPVFTFKTSIPGDYIKLTSILGLRLTLDFYIHMETLLSSHLESHPVMPPSWYSHSNPN